MKWNKRNIILTVALASGAVSAATVLALLLHPEDDAEAAPAEQTVTETQRPAPAPAPAAPELRQQALTGMYEVFAGIKDADSARKAAQELPAKAEAGLGLLAEASLPWPGCWGESAGLAEMYARRMAATLLYLQENECFGCMDLAEFINSPAFARYFGETFADKLPDPLDEPLGDFPIEKVSVEEILKDEEEPPTQADGE